MNAMDEFTERMFRNENLNPYALNPVQDREERMEKARQGAHVAHEDLNHSNMDKRRSNRHTAHEGLRSTKCVDQWDLKTVKDLMAVLRTDEEISARDSVRIEAMMRTHWGHAFVDGTTEINKRWLKRKISRIIPKRFRAKPLPRSNLNFDV